MPGLSLRGHSRSSSSSSSISSNSTTHAAATSAATKAQTSAATLAEYRQGSPTPVPASSSTLVAFHTVAANRLIHQQAISNYGSSGSPHDDLSTVCLAAMVHEFLEEEMSAASCGRIRCNCADGSVQCRGGDDEELKYCSCGTAVDHQESQLQNDHLCEILEGMTSCTSQSELLLLVDVSRVVEAESEELPSIIGDDSGDSNDAAHMTKRLRRAVMKRLRQEGYNAAICKSRWNHADGLPAGDYEYIDIVVAAGDAAGGAGERFVVDINFKAQFEIARASTQYLQLLGVLPRLFVGRAQRLKQILKIMSNAAKLSLKQQGLLLPPWRKHKYMQAKWFSPYRRTTKDSVSNNLPSSHEHLLVGNLGLGPGAPKMLPQNLAKLKMDLLYYMKVQVKQGYRDHPINNSVDLLNQASDENMGVNLRTLGFTNNEPLFSTDDQLLRSRLQEYSSSIHVQRCTDHQWQVPAASDEKWRMIGRSDTDRRVIASGISTVLKLQATSVLSDL